jgi:hypothetical protein
MVLHERAFVASLDLQFLEPRGLRVMEHCGYCNVR